MKIKAEYDADKYSVLLGNAKSLISALGKLENDDLNSFGFLDTAQKMIIKFYFSDYPTHPSFEDRIEKIKFNYNNEFEK